jgi:hypothetical protein
MFRLVWYSDSPCFVFIYGRVYLPIEEQFEDEESGEKFGNGKYAVRMRIQREFTRVNSYAQPKDQNPLSRD